MRLRTDTLFRRTAALLRAHPLPGLLWLLVLSATGTAIDALTTGDGREQVFVGLAATFGQFILTSALLRGEGLHHAWSKPGRAASYVGLGIISGLAIAAGLLLLILPGLYLYARWIVATPLVVGEGASMGEAMSHSWHRTQPAGGAIIAALTLIYLPWVAGMNILLFAYPAHGPAPLAIALAANLLFFASSIGAWYLAVAVHALLGGSDEDRPAQA